jgi:hypothetical protein
MFFTIFGFLLWRKLKMKFMLASMKSPTISNNPSSNPLQKVCSGFQIAACDSKRLFRKPPMILKIVPKAGHHMELEMIDPGQKESRNRNYYAAFGTIFKIGKCFRRIKHTICVYFSL